MSGTYKGTHRSVSTKQKNCHLFCYQTCADQTLVRKLKDYKHNFYLFVLRDNFLTSFILRVNVVLDIIHANFSRNFFFVSRFVFSRFCERVDAHIREITVDR